MPKAIPRAKPSSKARSLRLFSVLLHHHQSSKSETVKNHPSRAKTFRGMPKTIHMRGINIEWPKNFQVKAKNFQGKSKNSQIRPKNARKANNDSSKAKNLQGRSKTASKVRKVKKHPNKAKNIWGMPKTIQVRPKTFKEGQKHQVGPKTFNSRQVEKHPNKAQPKNLKNQKRMMHSNKGKTSSRASRKVKKPK